MNQTLSNVKGMGIILMVIGHAIAYLPGIYEVTYHFIYLFHMPLFFFCSGFFFHAKYTQAPQTCFEFIKKKIRGLWWPFVKWCLLFLVLDHLLNSWHFYPPETGHPETLRNYMGQLVYIGTMNGMNLMVGGFWFMAQLFYCSILACMLLWVLRKYSSVKNYVSIQMIAILILWAVCIGASYLHFRIPMFPITQRVFLCAAWFIAGQLYHDYENKVKLTEINGGGAQRCY
ncbi:acyltransferase family protein [Phocaeicola sp.]